MLPEVEIRGQYATLIRQPHSNSVLEPHGGVASMSSPCYLALNIYIYIYIYTHMGVVPSTGDDNLGCWIYPGVENVTAD